MLSLEQISTRICAAIAGARIETVPNASPSAQASLLIDNEHAREIAAFLRDDRELQFHYASNVTGVDWPEKTVKVKTKTKKVIDGVEKEVEELVEQKTPAFLEAVYHLYSMVRGGGPLILRLRTGNRTDHAVLPSLTPVWRSCEFQEREIYDLFGVTFEGHPDLRRILMWDGFEDHPMRKDYQPVAEEETKP